MKTTSFVKYLLLPFSVLYGCGVYVRNLLYRKGILFSEKFDIPILCVGNISAGGTGKTPHIEYLIRLLSGKYHIAVISRGYKRKTQGFMEVETSHTAREVGDEPLQIKQKFPSIVVVVDKDRKHGIHTLQTLHPDVELILMDDGFQHLGVKAGVNMVLMDYARLPMYDFLLPAGRLRETFEEGKKRASFFVVSKSPNSLPSQERERLEQQIRPIRGQKVFFSSLCYKGLLSFEDFIGNKREMLPLDELKHFDSVLLFTGIASPQPIKDLLKKYDVSFQTLSFSDHHDYTEKDIQRIETTLSTHSQGKTLLLTTEKDAIRLKTYSLSHPILKRNLYILMLEVTFHREEEFKETLLKLLNGDRIDQMRQ